MISTLEIARRLGITSVAVNNRIKKLEIEKIRRGVFAYVTEDDFERIAKLPLEPTEQTTSISTNSNSFTKFSPVDPLISENRALRQQLNDLQQEIQKKDLQQQEQLQMRQIDVEQERSTAHHQLQEKVKLLQEARRERTELRVLLFREQDLAGQHAQRTGTSPDTNQTVAAVTGGGVAKMDQIAGGLPQCLCRQSEIVEHPPVTSADCS